MRRLPVCGDNVKLGQPEILLGVIPGAGGTQRLPRLVGPARAKDLIFTGRFVEAAEALAIGLVDRVVAPDDVYATARDFVAPFVHGPAYALRAAKEAIDRGLEVPLDSGLEIERQQFAALFATEGPQHQDDLVRRERSRQGRVPRPMNPAGCRAARRDRGGVLRPEAGERSGQRHLARHGRCGPAEWAALVFSIDGLVADA